MDINYLGEHLLPGNLGKFAILMAFISALLSILFYWQAAKENPLDEKKWKKWARISFSAHSFFILLASIMLMYLLLNRYYEYRYVWVHTENQLGLGYLIASFWAGQEGSLLFWTLCQVVFGLLLIRFAKSWESTTMTVVSLSQLFMSSMLLGIHLGSLRIGMSPFILLREVPDNMTNEFFQNPFYLSMIVDGNGLNPLLRNFWMMSHPPVLFIGFAAALLPFSYAIAGLWKRKYTQWITPALPWMHQSIFFLGAGILLGGVWAYESLTFGGFWAWDPIENASLVPWIILVAALHLMLTAKRKQQSIFPAILFTTLGFVFVIYSTYLTRSGVLAETSVHSFGKDGMGPQILSYILTFLILGLVLLFYHYKKLPSKENEDPMTREFWLFIAAMVLILSAFQIIFTTSIPVINALFGSNLAPPINVVQHYNTWQLPFAVITALLMALAHFVNWGKNQIPEFLKRTSFSLILSVVFTTVLIFAAGVSELAHIIFLFAGLFACFSSLDMLFRFRNQLMNTPAIISHLGIALFFIAILLTFSQQQTISKNTSGYFLGEAFPENENLLLVKDEILPMGDYHVTYKGREKEGEDIFYHLDFLKKNAEGDFYKVFSSHPSIKLNERMGNVYNPYAKVYFSKDIFTYITFADVDHHSHDHNHEREHLETLEISINDTILFRHNKIILTALKSNTEDGVADFNDLKIEAHLNIITHFGDTYHITPVFGVQNQRIIHVDDTIAELDLSFRFKEVSEKPYTIELAIFEERPDFIIIKTIIFPYINLLWLSCVVMLLGFWMSFHRRWKKSKKESAS